MPLNRLDHVNIRKNNLAEMVRWYTEVLGLQSGPRPDFPFKGAWMYLGDHPVVHLVEKQTDKLVGSEADLKLEHIAFTGHDLDGFKAKLNRLNIEFHAVEIPNMNMMQVNIWDADKNHLHIDFKTDDEAESPHLNPV